MTFHFLKLGININEPNVNGFKWPLYNTKLSSQIKYIADDKIVNMRQFNS